MSSNTETNTEVGDLWPIVPNFYAAVIVLSAFAVSTIVHMIQLPCHKSLRIFIPFVIGGCFEVIGYIGRLISRTQVYSVGPYVVYALFVLLAPIVYAASIYGILERIIDYIHAEKLIPIKPSSITKIFISSDVITFLVQCGGGSLQTSTSTSVRQTATNAVLGGLAIQITFFIFFIYLTALLDYRTRNRKIEPNEKNWRALLRVVEVSCSFILIRTTYRIIEYSYGFNSYIMTHEVYFYMFDALMMFCVQILYNVVHPKKVLLEEIILSPSSVKPEDQPFKPVYPLYIEQL